MNRGPNAKVQNDAYNMFSYILDSCQYNII